MDRTPGERPYLVVDTGGLEPEGKGVFVEMARQARTGNRRRRRHCPRDRRPRGLTARDRAIGEELRRIGRRVFVASQAEGMQPSLATLEFHEMGSVRRTRFPPSTGKGCATWSKPRLPISPFEEESGGTRQRGPDRHRGRPNAGNPRSSNALVGEERVVTFEEPALRAMRSTSSSRFTPRYILVDTAGLRRRGKVFESVRSFRS